MKDELSVLRRHECCQANVGQSRRLSEVPFRFLRTEVVDARKHLGVSFVRKRDHKAVGIFRVECGARAFRVPLFTLTADIFMPQLRKVSTRLT